jgi:hypothetical protein
MAEYGTELLRRQLNGKVLVKKVFGTRPFSSPLYRTNTYPSKLRYGEEQDVRFPCS